MNAFARTFFGFYSNNERVEMIGYVLGTLHLGRAYVILSDALTLSKNWFTYQTDFDIIASCCGILLNLQYVTQTDPDPHDRRPIFVCTE